jgi:ATP-dependent Clp protease adaptor protein ClpS
MSHDFEGGMATLTRPKRREKSQVRRLPPYNVVLLNDDEHTEDFVVDVLFKVFGYTLERCVQLMLIAHTSGRSIVWTGSKEVAELKVEQIRTFHQHRDGADIGPLGCDIEPAPGS